jgi:hypothetical protein
VIPLLAAEAIIVRGVTLIDGTGGAPRPGSTVVIEEGRIAAVGLDPEIETPPGAQVLDGRGKFLVPGFVDMHAHVTYLEWKGDGQGRSKGVFDRKTSEKTLRLLLAFGVTTVRNPAAPAEDGVRLRDDVGAGRIAGPRIFTAGESLDMARSLDAVTRRVSTVEDVRREVRRQATIGVDYIKLYANLPPKLVAAGIEEAHARRLKVLGHLQATSWTEAANLGIDGLCHGADWSEKELPAGKREEYRRDVAARGPMKARLTWIESVDPKSPEIQAMIDSPRAPPRRRGSHLIASATKLRGDDRGISRQPRPRARPRTDARFLSAPLLRARLDAGGLPARARPRRDARPRRSYADERRAAHGRLRQARSLDRSGSEPAPEMALPRPGRHPSRRVLKMATSNAAKALGIEAEAGTIAVGKRADLVLLSGDPTAEISNTTGIVWVMKDGVRHDPKKLLAEAR